MSAAKYGASQMAAEQEAATRQARTAALAHGGRASLRGAGGSKNKNQQIEVAGARSASYNTHARLVAGGAHSWTINLRH